MKLLQQKFFGSDWGRFLYFAGNEGESFNWHKEVGGTSQEQQKERDAFYAKLGDEKQELKASVGHTFRTDKVLSVQLADFFNESTTEWSQKNHKKTFDALNRLTKLGYNVDRPSEFSGLTMTISPDGIVSVAAKKEKADIVEEKTLDKRNGITDKKPVAETENAVDENEKVINKESLATSKKEKIEGKVEGKTDNIIEDKKEEVKKEVTADDKKVIETEIKTTEKDLTDIKKVEELPAKEVADVIPEEEKAEKLTTTVISQDFLSENVKVEDEKKILEPETEKIKKTPDEAQELQGKLDQVNQDFASVKAQIQKALEGQFEKGKLDSITPAQMEVELQDNEKYSRLYEGVKPLFEKTRTLEAERKHLIAVLAVDALYDVKSGYKSRYDIKEEDVLDVEEEGKTDFAKKYETAAGTLQDLGDGTVENIALFNEMTEGVDRATLVVHAKKGMEDLAELGDPIVDDMPKIQTIKNQITEARTHGAVNEMFAEDELSTLLQKERRTSHMVAKANAEATYESVPEEYKEDISSLTEKALAKGDIYGLISLLATAMGHPLNKKKDPEVEKKEGETWDSKYLEQGTADGVEALILRRKQLEKTMTYSSQFEKGFSNDHVIFAKERLQGRDKTWLAEEDVDKFQKLEKDLNEIYSLYEGGEPSVLQADLERQYGGQFIKRIEAARANVDFRLSQPDMVGHDAVKSKVDVTEAGGLSFVKVEKASE